MENNVKEMKSANENIYFKYFNEMQCFLSVQDRNMRLKDCNKLFREHFGAKVGEYCYEVYKGRMSKCDECPVDRTFETGIPQQGEQLVTNLKGEEIPVYIYTSPIFNKDGEVESVLEISSNISTVKKIQKKLHKTQKQLYQFFDAVPCYITLQDKDLKITSTNRKFREDFGVGGGAYCYEVYKHRDEPCLECPVIKTFKDGHSHQSEEVVTTMSGDRHNVLVSTAPVRDSDGELSHVIEMSTDITQIRQLQDQLTSLGLLVGSISHGIKGLSSALDGGIYLLNSGLKKNDQGRIDKGWDIVQRNVSRIRSMISDILYYAKDREINHEKTDVALYVADISTTMESKAGNFKVYFEHSCAPSIGEFTVDLTAMRSALINILENSFDACRKDISKSEHTVTFDVLEDSSKNNIVFEISDNGIGMDRETKEKIFSLFFSSKGIDGTGLGLFISNKIIRKHGGSIDVTSRQREGASFRIIVPRSPEIKTFKPEVVVA